jgi:hypothetical protein
LNPKLSSSPDITRTTVFAAAGLDFGFSDGVLVAFCPGAAGKVVLVSAAAAKVLAVGNAAASGIPVEKPPSVFGTCSLSRSDDVALELADDGCNAGLTRGERSLSE